MTTDSTQGTSTQVARGDEPVVVYVREPKHWGRNILIFIGVVGLLIAGGFALAAVNLFPHIRNPFATQVTDRTGPVLLQSIEDLNQFVAARGNFQVVVDYKEDRPYVPDFISSYHVLFVGQGSVDAYVDFTSLSEGAIQISGDGAEVTVTLPDPQLSEVHMDVNQSRIYSLDEGIFDKVKGLVADDYNRQGQLYQLASEKIKTAAIESELIDRARDNTRIKLEGILRSMGYERVTINFTPTPQ